MPKKAIQKTATNTVGSGLQPFERPLNGKLVTAEDPMLIGRTDFTVLKNLRYNDTGIEGVNGMSKINASPFVVLANNCNILSGYHFHKDIPAVEDHVLAQSLYSTYQYLLRSDGAAIPAQDTFTSIYSSFTSYLPFRYTSANDGSVIVCDGNDNYIWSGNEHIIGAFIASTADITTSITNPADNTDKMQNSDTTETVTLGADTYTKLLLHLDGTDASTTFTDSTGTHTPGANGNAKLDTDYQKFGTASLILDGTGDFLNIADHADFQFGTGNFTIDMWVRFNDVTNSQHLISKRTDDNNYWKLYYGVVGATRRLYFKSVVASADVYDSFVSWTPALNTWYHVAFVRSGTTGYFFVNGASPGTQNTTTDFGSGNVGVTSGDVQIGAMNGLVAFNGWIDEVRVSKGIARWTSAFSPPVSAYTTYRNYAIIGTTRPLEGVKFYINTGNTITSTLSVSHWTGSSWTALTVTDNTASGGVALASTGTVTWTSTVGVSKMRYFNGYFLYWYKVSINAGESQLYMITTTPAFQKYADAWDGQLRPCLACWKSTATDIYEDNSINVLENDFSTTSDTDTFMDVSSLPNDDYIIVGFLEKMTGIQIRIPLAYGNDNASVMTVSYWDGIAWNSVSDQYDGTAVSGKTLKQTGVVTWRHESSTPSETMRTIGTVMPLYYYRIAVGSTLDAATYIDQIQGIPAPNRVGGFKIPVMWQQRLWLLNGVGGKSNLALGSAADLPESMNGTDSVELIIGDCTEITAAKTMYTRYGSNIYDNMIVCKASATHLIDGYSPETFRIYTLSDSVGCVAPHTMARCDVNFEIGEGTTKHVCIWQAAHGIVMTDGNTITTISDDIKNFFDPDDSDYISRTLIESFYGFYDKMKQEYHWLFGTGTDTSLTREMVYDLRRKKWYEMSRSTKYLQSGWGVVDSYGYGYNYGGMNGYIQRLENGATWDGTNITYNFKSSDTPLANSTMVEAEARKFKLTAKAKTSAEEITVTWYTDGNTTGTALTTINQTNANRRFYDAVRSFTLKGMTHQYDVTVTTDNGFDPLMVSGLYRPIRADILSRGD